MWLGLYFLTCHQPSMVKVRKKKSIIGITLPQFTLPDSLRKRFPKLSSDINSLAVDDDNDYNNSNIMLNSNPSQSIATPAEAF